MGSMEPVYIGIKGRVICIDRQSGATRWTTQLLKRYFVNLHRDGDDILASTHGELFCLDARSGTIKWRNPLPGMGRGLITIAGNPGNWAAIAQQQDEQAQAAVASGAAGAG